MSPEDYDAWYTTARGRWMGATEYRLAARQLAARPGQSLLDVGCGTGWFTRRFALAGLAVTGLDANPDWLDYARIHSDPAIRWVAGDARQLPFADSSYDQVASIAALCFVEDERGAVAEVVRVARRRFAIGWLNRASLLHRQKAGRGAYAGARWHTAAEVRALFEGLPVRGLTLRSAIFLPSASPGAVLAERVLPGSLAWGGLLMLAGEKTCD